MKLIALIGLKWIGAQIGEVLHQVLTRSGIVAQYQQFIAGIDQEVVGKSLNDIEVTKVSGSSLTSGGFNEALAQIKSEAAA